MDPNPHPRVLHYPPATNETLNVKPPSMSNFDDDRSTRSWYDLRVVCALCILLSANGDVRDRRGAPRQLSLVSERRNLNRFY